MAFIGDPRRALTISSPTDRARRKARRRRRNLPAIWRGPLDGLVRWLPTMAASASNDHGDIGVAHDSLVPRQAEQRPQADADQAAGKRRHEPDPAVQRAGRNAADEGADIAAEAEARAPAAEQAADSGGQQRVRPAATPSRANGLVAAAAAIAPNSMPKSVRLDVSDRTDSRSALFRSCPLPELGMGQVDSRARSRSSRPTPCSRRSRSTDGRRP